MADDLRATLTRQYETAWKLAAYHFDGLTDEACMWRPAARGPHVHRGPGGAWRADWPEREGYELGPPSIAWLTWHIGYWWSMAIDHTFGEATLTREAVIWPGDAARARVWIGALGERWSSKIGALSEDELLSPRRTRWPFVDRPLADLVAWVTVELTKNAAEIGYARFLYGA